MPMLEMPQSPEPYKSFNQTGRRLFVVVLIVIERASVAQMQDKPGIKEDILHLCRV